MGGMNPNAPDAGPTTIFCPQCGQAMRIAPEHLQTTVACPHCRHTLEPWRFVETIMPGAAPPGPPVVPPVPPVVPPAHAYGLHGPGTYSWRNRWVAGALGIVLGVFGVHRFYLGFTGLGVVQLVLTVGSLFMLSPVVAIWTFIEGILCFCGAIDDADGLPLRG